MALNAVLRVCEDPGYGRSYMEHVVALAADPTVSEELRAAAQTLRETQPVPPTLITLGKPDLRALEAARAIVTYARARVSENG